MKSSNGTNSILTDEYLLQVERNESKSRTSITAEGLVDGYGRPFAVPNYSLQELRDAVPNHCFERSALTGSLYLLRDVVLMAFVFIVSYTFIVEEYISSPTIRALLWALYTIIEGLIGLGVWVIAHECNHGAFSEYPLLNDIVGWTMHSLLLVPYFSWKITHKRHHSVHNNLQKDLQFVPKSHDDYAIHSGKAKHSKWELTEDTPLWTAIELVGQQLIGWPRYLLTNDSGSDGWKDRKDGKQVGKAHGLFGGVNHVDPASPLFNDTEGHLIIMSDIGLIMTLSLTTYIGYVYGWMNIVIWYWIPYLWVNHWLVAIAYLHHTDPSLPKYQPEAWNYVRGAAATIDRDFGFIGRHIFHDIIETHVLHHTFPTVPFYHAREATEAIKTVMGPHYRSDKRDGSIGFLKSMWLCARWCQWVEPNVGAKGQGKAVWFYRNNNGLGVPPAMGLSS